MFLEIKRQFVIRSGLEESKWICTVAVWAQIQKQHANEIWTICVRSSCLEPSWTFNCSFIHLLSGFQGPSTDGGWVSFETWQSVWHVQPWLQWLAGMVQASALLQLLWILCSQKRPGGEWEHFEQNFRNEPLGPYPKFTFWFSPPKNGQSVSGNHIFIWDTSWIWQYKSSAEPNHQDCRRDSRFIGGRSQG